MAKKKAPEQNGPKRVNNPNVMGLRPEVLEALSLSGMDARALIARAFLEIGENAQRIGNLNVSPELLETLTGK